MAEYVYIENYTKRGNLAISTAVFDAIVLNAIDRIKGVKLKGANKANFSLHNTAHCEIKNGRLNTDLEVIISKECNVNEVCLLIQEEVSDALTSMTEIIPFSINVKVVGIE